MNKIMFVVYDNKAELYSSPFFSVRKESAVRDFLRAAQSPESEIHHTPADYDLYAIGTYEDETALITPWTQKEFITNAYVLAKQAEGDQS